MGMPTGPALVTATVCGRELGELATPARGSEVELEPVEVSLSSDPSEELRGPSRPR